MQPCDIEKINELARKAKTCGLTDEEKELQKCLREQYIADFRRSMTTTLDNTVIQRPDGSREKLKRKDCECE